jgi:hypothetical protein
LFLPVEEGHAEERLHMRNALAESCEKDEKATMGIHYTDKGRREEDQCHGGNGLHRRAVAQRGLGDLGRASSEVVRGSGIALGYEIIYLGLV